VAAVLVLLGWRNRTLWLPAARTHRATAVVSRSRSLAELAVMAVALTLAAGLAVTG
jgi:copper resistance protein D